MSMGILSSSRTRAASEGKECGASGQSPLRLVEPRAASPLRHLDVEGGWVWIGDMLAFKRLF